MRGPAHPEGATELANISLRTAKQAENSPRRGEADLEEGRPVTIAEGRRARTSTVLIPGASQKRDWTHAEVATRDGFSRHARRMRPSSAAGPSGNCQRRKGAQHLGPPTHARRHAENRPIEAIDDENTRVLKIVWSRWKTQEDCHHYYSSDREALKAAVRAGKMKREVYEADVLHEIGICA